MMNLNPVSRREGAEEDHLRLLLIGKAGSGKSATGNTIFNESVFQSKIGSSSVTKTCEPHTDAVNNRRVTVIDTPDVFFSTDRNINSDSEMKKALELCSPGAHVILLILSFTTFTEQEMKGVRRFEQMFGSEALRFTLVIFTHAENISNSQLRSMIGRNNALSVFINRCGGGVCGMNNKDPANRRQVTKLMEKIDRLVSENTNSCYTLEMMLETERRRQEEERRAEEEKREEEERREREHLMTLDGVKEETEIRVRRELQMTIDRVKEETGIRVRRELQMTIDRVKEETEKHVRREPEEQERAKILEKPKKTEKSEKMKKYFKVMMGCALATGGVLVLWRLYVDGH